MLPIRMSAYAHVLKRLRNSPETWLVTGIAGFIGSNLLEHLLTLNQRVVGLDNFSTGHRRNLEAVKNLVSASQWRRFRLLEGDIANLDLCRRACAGVRYVLHHAALGSVPGSLADPLACHRSNATGFLNVLEASRQAKVTRVVYASSSAVYGDLARLPNVEELTGIPLSPYAASKTVNEVYAAAFGRAYQTDTIGLRYFNVFGPRQDPAGAYAAVIPAWISALLEQRPIYINGDGKTTRDFCYVGDVVQANLLAATTRNPRAVNQVFNIALGRQTTLNQLLDTISKAICSHDHRLPEIKPVYREFRAGDVRHSVANISKARRLLGYAPGYKLQRGLAEAMQWYTSPLGTSSSAS